MRKEEKKITISKEDREKLISEIQEYFLEERDEELGNLAASFILDFIIKNIAPTFYNQGIRDSIRYINERVEDMYGLEL